MRFGSLALTCAASMAATVAMAQSVDAGVSDPEIAHIAETALREEIATADLAFRKTDNRAIKLFARDAARFGERRNSKYDHLPGKLKLKLEDNDMSRSLSGAAARQREQLSGLADAAFDKAYVENEMLYDALIVGALETTLTPSAKDGELKGALEASLAFFRRRLSEITKISASLQ